MMKQLSINNIVKPVILCICLAYLISCNEDPGNYTYTDINTVKIEDVGHDKEGLKDRTYSSGDTLKIKPILTFSQGEDESGFTFTWYYLNNKDQNNKEWIVLQEGRNLEIEVAGPIGKPTEGTAYSLAYEVKNKNTGILYRALFKLTVLNPLTRGYAALCEHDDGFDIDLLAFSSDNKFSLYKNVLEMVESELPRSGVKPYDILAFDDPMAPDPYNREGAAYSVFILTDQYTTRIKSADYSWKSSYDISNSIERNSYLDKEYVQKGKPVIAQKMKTVITTTSSSSIRTMIYHKEPNGQGNWYLCSVSPGWSFFSVQMNKLRPSGEGRYEPAPHIHAGNYGALYFDADSKKFMYGTFPTSATYDSQQLYYTQPLPAEASGGATFNFSDPNDGLLYMGETLDAWYPDGGYAILKQSDGSFKYIEFISRNVGTVASLVADINKRRVSAFPAGSSIGDAKFIARAPLLSNQYLYYVTNDNKVYKASISSVLAVEQDITSSILTSDEYSEITLFKFTLPNSHDIGVDFERTLAVGTYNAGLGKATGGKLEFFRQSGSGNGALERTKYPPDAAAGDYQVDMSWTGLGKIVGLTYKQK